MEQHGHEHVGEEVLNYSRAQVQTMFEPYMYQLLLSYVSQSVVVETDKGAMRGTLVDVNPDIITLEVSGNYYFIRIKQMNWIMPVMSR